MAIITLLIDGKMVNPEVIIGVPVNRQSGFALDFFLQNQALIRQNTPFPLKIVFSTEDKEFYPELRDRLAKTDLEYEILLFDVEKPAWAKDRIWALTQAREEIRRYCIEKDAAFLIFLDSDMTFDPGLVNELVKKAEEGYDVVYNCYLLKNGRVTFNGFGGTLIHRNIYPKVAFRCYETEDHSGVVDEGFYFEMDLRRMNARIFSGMICESHHYLSPDTSLVLRPRPLTCLEKIKSSSLIRKPISLFAGMPGVMVVFVKIGYFLGKHVW